MFTQRKDQVPGTGKHFDIRRSCHGERASRLEKHQGSDGYWGRRPFCCSGYGKWIKTHCHRIERRIAKIDLLTMID